MRKIEKLTLNNYNVITLYTICETEEHINYYLGHCEKNLIEVISYHKETETTTILSQNIAIRNIQDFAEIYKLLARHRIFHKK